MLRSEAWEILSELWDNANEKQREALHIAQNDIQFVDLMPDDMVAVVRCKDCLYYNTYGCSPGCGWCEHFDRGEFDNHYCYGADRKDDAI